MPKAREIKLNAYAKINMTLDITGVRDDGYHLMDMVNRSVGINDEVTISLSRDEGILMRSNSKYMPCDERNHAHKAAVALAKAACIPLPSISIYIKKRIPTQAGLGGGSSDAAATLVGLNQLLGLGLGTCELCDIGKTVGADVPFCIVGGAARVTGIGDIIEPIEDNGDYSVVVAMPNHGCSTREAFSEIDSRSDFERPDTPGMIACLKNGDVSGMAIKLCNVFYTALRHEHSEALFPFLLQGGALGASLSGSGAAVFGVFKNHLDAQRCCADIRRKNLRCFAARPTLSGTSVIYIK